MALFDRPEERNGAGVRDRVEREKLGGDSSRTFRARAERQGPPQAPHSPSELGFHPLAQCLFSRWRENVAVFVIHGERAKASASLDACPYIVVSEHHSAGR